MDILTLETARKALMDRRLLIVARAIGVSYGTLKRIRDGVAKRPSRRVLMRLTEYITAGREVRHGQPVRRV